VTLRLILCVACTNWAMVVQEHRGSVSYVFDREMTTGIRMRHSPAQVVYMLTNVRTK
jgi:hypothetical protein